MLEKLMLRGAALARKAARERRSDLAQALGDALPADVRVGETDDGIELEGRGLRRRSILEPALRWPISGRRG